MRHDEEVQIQSRYSARGGGAGVVFPYDVEQEFGTKGKVPVKSTLDGAPYTGSLINCGASGHMLGVLKAFASRSAKAPETQSTSWSGRMKRREPSRCPRPNSRRFMKKEGLLAGFEKLSYTHRKEYCRWITEAKKEETRQRGWKRPSRCSGRGVKTPG